MAGPQPVYSLERLAHRDGYRLKDVDGNFLGDEERREKEGDKWVWNDTPTELTTELDIKEIYKSWVERSPVGRPLYHCLPGYFPCTDRTHSIILRTSSFKKLLTCPL